jgi:hypothetical protein
MPNLSTLVTPSSSITADKLSGGQSGSAPIYGARAWVNFDGQTANNLVGTYGRSGNTITVTAAGHGLRVGHRVDMTFAAGTGGTATSTVFLVVSVNGSQFTLTDASSGTITGNPAATIRRRLIRTSGNIANVGYSTDGAYIINFTTALPTSDYCLTGSGRYDTSSVDLNVPVVGIYRGAGPLSAPTADFVHLGVVNPASPTVGINCNLVSVAVFC